MTEQTVLIVDDEHEIADLLELYLKNDSFHVAKFYHPIEAFQYIEQNTVDLAILDVMMPDMDGFSLCTKIRQRHLFPIIMLTAKEDAFDKIQGLTLGADDYIIKPFNPLEVVARVKTQLRRFKQYNSSALFSNNKNEYEIRGLSICRQNHKCTLNGEALALTPIEFDLLWYLCEHAGEVVSCEKLFEEIWHETYFESNNNTVMAHIARLREKMKEPTRKPNYIKTVWGVGYAIELLQ